LFGVVFKLYINPATELSGSITVKEAVSCRTDDHCC